MSQMMSVSGDLILDRLELENFKSYAGRVIVGPFHEKFSAIVGPNGSGKSNIIDSLLFVFGRRAAQLRQKKATDLIHRSRRCKPSFARVTVHMARTVPREAKENESPEKQTKCTMKRQPAFVVAREIHLDGKSRYVLDGRTINHTEMVTFVREQGIDLEHNRFLILQGEVEQLAMMPPKKKREEDSAGFLEILEDLIGSNQFIEKIAKGEAEMNEQEDCSREAQRKLKLAELDLRNIATPCKQAFSFVQCQKRLIAAKADLEAKERHRYRREIVIKQSQAQPLEAEIAEIVKLRECARKELEEMTSRLTKAKRVVDTTKGEVQKLTIEERKRKDLEDKESSAIDKLKTRIETDRKEIVKQEKRAIKCEEEAQDILTRAETAKKEKPTLENELKKVTQSLEALDAKLLDETRNLTDMKAKLETQREQLQSSKAADTKRLASLQAEHDMTRTDLYENKDRVDDLRVKYKQQKENLQKLEQDVKSCTESKAKFEEAHRNYLAELSDLQAQEASLRAKISELEQKLALKQREKKSRFVMYNALRKEFNRPAGRLRGMGRWLLDSVKCDAAKHGIPLSAAGLQEDSCLVEDERAAAEVIEFVKINKLGKVNCIIVPKLGKQVKGMYEDFQRRKASGALTVPGLTLAVDLLDYEDESIKPFIYYKIRDTYIMLEGSWDDANRLAKSDKTRRRVVNTEGSVIEKNGSQSGGRIDNFFIARDQPVALDNDEYVKCQREKETLIEQCNNVNLRQRELQGKWRDKGLTAERDSNYEANLLERALEKRNAAQQSLASFTTLLERAEQEIAKKTVDPAQVAHLKAIEKELSAMSNAAAGWDEKLRVVGEQLQKLEKKLCNVGGDDRKRLQDRKAALEEELKSCDMLAINATSMVAEESEKARQIREEIIPKIRKQVDEYQNDIVVGEERLLKAKNERLDYQEQRVELETEVEKEEKVFKEISAAKQTAEEEYKQSAFFEKHKRDELGDIIADIKSIEKKCEEKTTLLGKLREDFDDLPVLDEEMALAMADEESQHGQPSSSELMVPKKEDAEVRVKTEPQSIEEDEETAEIIDEKALVVDFARVAFPDVDDIDKYEAVKMKEFQLSFHKAEMAKAQLISGRNKEEGGLMDVTVLDNFKAKAQVVKQMKIDVAHKTSRLDALCAAVDQLRDERRIMFKDGFVIISNKVKELYQMLTRGGDAELEYKDPAGPFSEGIEFSVRPPGKSWRIIQNLSGGEKTLSSLAFIFALHHYKPTPIYFLDEIDAALDPNNVVIIASYVAAYQSQAAQFIVISLRNQFFERANRLIGVCKVDDVTQTCVLDPDDYAVAESPRSKAGGSAGRYSLALGTATTKRTCEVVSRVD